MDFFQNLPQLARNFLSHKLTIEGKSELTVKEYAYDLQTFFRFMIKHLKKDNSDFQKIDISSIDLEFIKLISITDVYEYLMFLNKTLNNNTRTRARKLSCVKSFYKYLNVSVHLIEKDIVKDLQMPKITKSLPRYLELEESKELLLAVDGKNKERDFLMLMILLNCGLRVSELANINVSDIKNDALVVMGKGSKERQLFLNDATLDALSLYLNIRNTKNTKTKKLFLSNQGKEISIAGIQYIIKNLFRKAGLDATKLSTHKLRHTAATLMYKYGNVDIKTLQTVLGHINLNTTEIYTHTDDKMVKDAIRSNPLSNFKK